LTASQIEQFVGSGVTPDEALKRHAVSRPSDPAYTFLSFGDAETSNTLSYGELHRKASRIAALIREHCAAHSRVLLLFPPGPDFVTAFFGCLYAGVIAVPSDLPRRRSRWGRLQSIIQDAQPSLLLSVTSALDSLRNQATEEDCWLTSVKAAAVDTLTDSPVPDRLAESTPENIAFLQYTSGSTSTPKGVMVSHRNVMATILDMQRGWQHDGQSIMVTWLPTFHDMGLIYGTLLPIVCGFPCYAMAPAAFLQKPLRWLEAISRLRGTHSAAANFAYQFCVDKITSAQSEGLDLSSWRVAVNGAEPVRPETLEGFAARFGPLGFRATALCPGYGLAESSLKVTAARVGKPLRIPSFSGSALGRGRVVSVPDGSPDARRLVSCGTGEIGARIAIVDPETAREIRDPDEIGEIWVRSDSVTAGYWEKPAETAASFQATLSSETGDAKDFLRTGDLGFFFEGQLYVMGRVKDLIIANGINIHPQDLEVTVAMCHPQLAGCQGAAFSVEQLGAERIVIVQEVTRTESRRVRAEEIYAAIREALWDRHEVRAEAIVLLKPATIPKTTSGKIQRRECSTRYLAGSLEELDHWVATPVSATQVSATAGNVFDCNSADDLQSWVISWIARRKSISGQAISPDTPFADLGMDSVDAVSFASAFFEHLGRKDSRETLLWDYPTVRALCSGFTRLPQTTPAPGRVDDDLENLSEAELERLLLAELSAGNS
jgi:acyl-CoA synthetase (AMP-forming)/AMP-acid ligase II/acyl carrier protein